MLSRTATVLARSRPLSLSLTRSFASNIMATSYKTVATDGAPAAIGPYCQATKVNGFIFASGSIPLDPKTMTVVEGGITEQTEQVFKNIEAVLAGSGAKKETVVKTTCFIKDMNDFVKFNEVYSKFFGELKPARSCVEVARLPKDVLVEVEFIATEA